MAFQYVIGVEFLSEDEAFRNRMVELVQSIDAYRHKVRLAGRTLDAQQASLEWIDLFGREFFAKA